MVTVSPYYLIVAAGFLVGAVLMVTKLRQETPVSIPAGILMALAGLYILGREFIKGFADNAAIDWTARGVLVVFLIYLFLNWNNVRAERHAEFDDPADAEGEDGPPAAQNEETAEGKPDQ